MLWWNDTPIDGITDKWVMGVFNALEDEVYRLVGEGTLDQHPHIDLNFVNAHGNLRIN